jgi:hypothetical protein
MRRSQLNKAADKSLVDVFGTAPATAAAVPSRRLLSSARDRQTNLDDVMRPAAMPVVAAPLARSLAPTESLYDETRPAAMPVEAAAAVPSRRLLSGARGESNLDNVMTPVVAASSLDAVIPAPATPPSTTTVQRTPPSVTPRIPSYLQQPSGAGVRVLPPPNTLFSSPPQTSPKIVVPKGNAANIRRAIARDFDQYAEIARKIRGNPEIPDIMDYANGRKISQNIAEIVIANIVSNGDSRPTPKQITAIQNEVYGLLPDYYEYLAQQQRPSMARTSSSVLGQDDPTIALEEEEKRREAAITASQNVMKRIVPIAAAAAAAKMALPQPSAAPELVRGKAPSAAAPELVRGKASSAAAPAPPSAALDSEWDDIVPWDSSSVQAAVPVPVYLPSVPPSIPSNLHLQQSTQSSERAERNRIMLEIKERELEECNRKVQSLEQQIQQTKGQKMNADLQLMVHEGEKEKLQKLVDEGVEKLKVKEQEIQQMRAKEQARKDEEQARQNADVLLNWNDGGKRKTKFKINKKMYNKTGKKYNKTGKKYNKTSKKYNKTSKKARY